MQVDFLSRSQTRILEKIFHFPDSREGCLSKEDAVKSKQKVQNGRAQFWKL